MSRLTIDLTDEQHKNLKAVAALQGKTIRQYSLEKLFPPASDEDEAWEEFKEFMNKRVDQALDGKFSKRNILDIANDGLRRAQSQK
jgi:uncharacterized protein (DUF1778 family)